MSFDGIGSKEQQNKYDFEDKDLLKVCEFERDNNVYLLDRYEFALAFFHSKLESISNDNIKEMAKEYTWQDSKKRNAFKEGIKRYKQKLLNL